MLGLSLWTLFYGLQLVSGPQYLKITFLKLQYLGVLSIPASLLSFSLRYSGSIRKMHLSGILLLSFVPIIMFILILTNDYHHLFWSSHNLIEHSSIEYLSNEFGIFLWINVIYSYILIFLATILLLLTAWKKSAMFRLQSGLLTFGIIFPWITNIISTFDKDLFSAFDITIVGFFLTGISIHMAIIKFNLLDITPIARDYMMNRMADPVIILDKEGRMVEANKAAIGYLNVPNKKSIGKVLSRNHTDKDDVFSHLQDLKEGKGHHEYHPQCCEGSEGKGPCC